MTTKKAIRAVLPASVVNAIKRQRALWDGRALRRRLEIDKAVGPAFLDRAALSSLQDRYDRPPLPRYSSDALLERGDWRANFLDQMYRPSNARPRSLEIGCWDGMVSAGLQKRSWNAAAMDRLSVGFDERARAAGVHLSQMDGAHLAFEDDTFDFVFSYDTFEHLEDPSATLAEMIRVTKDGGAIYLDFGPLYNSAFGLHAYRSIKVPFCQFLFDRQTLDEFCCANRLAPIKWRQLNQYSLAEFRDLWRSAAPMLDIVDYSEVWSQVGWELIQDYPSCFQAKALTLEELSVAQIRALFRISKARRWRPNVPFFKVDARRSSHEHTLALNPTTSLKP